jgi:hypothetical protein
MSSIHPPERSDLKACSQVETKVLEDLVTMPAIQLKVDEEVVIYFFNTSAPRSRSKTDWIICKVAEAACLSSTKGTFGIEVGSKIPTAQVSGRVKLIKTDAARRSIAVRWLMEKLKHWPDIVSAQLLALIIRDSDDDTSMLSKAEAADSMGVKKFNLLCGGSTSAAATIYKEYRDGYRSAYDTRGSAVISGIDGNKSSVTYTTSQARLQIEGVMMMNEASRGSVRSSNPGGYVIQPGSEYRISKIVRRRLK